MLQNIADMARNSARLIAIGWRNFGGIMVTQSVLTLLQGVMPFAKEGAKALLVNDIVRSLAAGQHTLTERQIWEVALLVVLYYIPVWLNAWYWYLYGRVMILMTEHMDLRIIA